MSDLSWRAHGWEYLRCPSDTCKNRRYGYVGGQRHQDTAAAYHTSGNTRLNLGEEDDNLE